MIASGMPTQTFPPPFSGHGECLLQSLHWITVATLDGVHARHEVAVIGQGFYSRPAGTWDLSHPTQEGGLSEGVTSPSSQSHEGLVLKVEPRPFASSCLCIFSNHTAFLFLLSGARTSLPFFLPPQSSKPVHSG